MKTYHLTSYFIFALLFFPAVFIIIYGLPSIFITNQKFKMKFLIICSKHARNNKKKKTRENVKEDLLKSIKENDNESDPNLGEMCGNVRKL